LAPIIGRKSVPLMKKMPVRKHIEQGVMNRPASMPAMVPLFIFLLKMPIMMAGNSVLAAHEGYTSKPAAKPGG
jgi:hypothetical protein